MKAILFYLVAAMAVMFTLPATAAEDSEGFAPVYSHAIPEIVVIDDSPMLAERSPMPRLEAAVIMASKSKQWPDGYGLAKLTDNRAALGDGPVEVGWQSSITAT
jgi:hypothetical protein